MLIRLAGFPTPPKKFYGSETPCYTLPGIVIETESLTCYCRRYYIIRGQYLRSQVGIQKIAKINSGSVKKSDSHYCHLEGTLRRSSVQPP
jgi:hypothetical protein